MAVNARGSAAHTATRRRAYQDGALRPEWQCRLRGAARSGPSGSALHMELHAQARVAVPPTLPLDVERTETVRPGPSGSVLHMELRAQGRVAVPTTLPLDVERTGCTPSHCHSTSSVPKRYVQARVAVSSTWNCALRAEWQCRPRGAARSGPSGSADHTATRRRAYGLHALTLPLDVERTEDVALAPDDLAYAKAVALPRAVPGHPRLAGSMTSSGNVPL